MFGQLYHLSGATAKRRARALLERFDLIDAASRLVRTYSGGMRRRLDGLYPRVVIRQQRVCADQHHAYLVACLAEHQPFSVFITAVRGLVLNQPDATVIWQTIAWCVGLLVVIIPLAIWAYGRRTARSA
jgi:hypothetical protein